jgi:thioredoxin reductase (NADPH)
VENYPGFADAIMGPDLMAAMREQSQRFGAELIPDDVTAVDLTGPVKRVSVADGTTWTADAVILAMGSGYRRLGVDGEDRLSGRGVSWCATCDGFFFRGQDIAVVGGGDSAMEEAIFLTKFANSVTLVHRREELRASAIMADRARANDKITFRLNTVVDAVEGRESVEGLAVTDRVSGEKSLLPVSGVFEAIGHDPRSELLQGQVDLDDDGYVLVKGRSTRTNLGGVFACGDLVDHTYRQAVTAAGSGCAAALDAERFLATLTEAERVARPVETVHAG